MHSAPNQNSHCLSSNQKLAEGTSLVSQQLRICLPTQGLPLDVGLIPVQKTKIPHASWHSQKKNPSSADISWESRSKGEGSECGKEENKHKEKC